jgi:protein gp37
MSVYQYCTSNCLYLILGSVESHKMNKQNRGNGRRGIEWTDYTWNPVGGCHHGCRWEMPDGTIAECYAETIAKRVAQNTYTHGFEYHYWNPHVLEEPLKLKKPSKIFMDSMSDLMGHWVPDDQVNQVLDICRQAPLHSFQLLTKNAPRLKEFKFPENVWVGVSAPPTTMFNKHLSIGQQVRMLQIMLKILRSIDVPVHWMSIEPLSFDIAPYLRESKLQWAVIGAATNGPKTYQPREEWIVNVLRVLKKQKTRVFFKGNLIWQPWYEEFPDYTKETPQVVELQQQLL